MCWTWASSSSRAKTSKRLTTGTWYSQLQKESLVVVGGWEAPNFCLYLGSWLRWRTGSFSWGVWGALLRLFAWSANGLFFLRFFSANAGSKLLLENKKKNCGLMIWWLMSNKGKNILLLGTSASLSHSSLILLHCCWSFRHYIHWSFVSVGNVQFSLLHLQSLEDEDWRDFVIVFFSDYDPW